jgi:hypothetical protein
MSTCVGRVVSRVAFAAVAVAVCCLFNAPARADQIVIISSSPTLELIGQPLSFSFEFDATTAAVVDTPVISFNGSTFTFNAGASTTAPTFVFEDSTHQIEIGDIATIPQPGIEGFPAIGVYPGLVVGLDGSFSGFNGTVTVTAAAESGLLALLGAGLLLLAVRPFRALLRGA